MQAWLGSIESDPLAGYAVFKSNELVQKVGNFCGWPLLPLHLHEILLSALFHFVVYALTGPILRMTTSWYSKLSVPLKKGVAVHASSEANALLLMAFSFPMFFCPKLDSLVSYTPYAGFVAALASGYFLFDSIMCLRDLDLNGWGFFGHGLTALFVFLQGNRPFMHDYSAPFIWFEASTTFVNIHWLASNVPGIMSKRSETINGACLILVFILCRIIPGPINGYQLFKVALTTELPGVPVWIVVSILSCYTLLSCLNFFWFGKMVTVAYEVLFGSSSKDDSAKVDVPIDEQDSATTSIKKNPQVVKRS